MGSEENLRAARARARGRAQLALAEDEEQDAAAEDAVHDALRPGGEGRKGFETGWDAGHETEGCLRCGPVGELGLEGCEDEL